MTIRHFQHGFFPSGNLLCYCVNPGDREKTKQLLTILNQAIKQKKSTALLLATNISGAL